MIYPLLSIPLSHLYFNAEMDLIQKINDWNSLHLNLKACSRIRGQLFPTEVSDVRRKSKWRMDPRTFLDSFLLPHCHLSQLKNKSTPLQKSGIKISCEEFSSCYIGQSDHSLHERFLENVRAYRYNTPRTQLSFATYWIQATSEIELNFIFLTPQARVS